MQLRPLKPAVYMFQTDASTATSECRLNLLRHHMNKCCDQPAATLFSGLQTLSGGGCCIQRMNTFNIYESTTTKIEVLTAVVIRLSLGRRSVNLLPVAQRTNAFTNGVVDRPWVVGREFESHVHHENAFLKNSAFAHVTNMINHSPWVPRDCKELRSRHVRPHTKTKNLAL